jgi:thiol-disulfide isomerase/thioredoxin
MNGQSIGSRDLQGKVVLITFFATWCVPCQWEAADLVALQMKYGTNGLVVVGVATRQPSSELTGFVADQHVNYTVCPSVDSMLWDYDVLPTAAIPVTAIIDRNGVLSAWYRYYHPRDYHESIVLPLLDAPTTTRPRLNIQRSGNELRLAWPSTATNFVLEARTVSPPAATWTPSTSVPTVSNGLNNVTLPVQRGARLYRLRKI